MRRLVALIVIALIGATAYGLASPSSGIGVNGVTLSSPTFQAELRAISTNPSIQCFITALDPVSFGPGAGAASITATGASAWANLRIEGIAITQYVKKNLKFNPSAAQLTQAQTSLEAELTQAALAKQYNCPGTAAQALALMPAEMRNSQVLGQAASLYLLSKLNSTIPLTTASMQSYYGAHTSSYDTLCVSIALVPTTSISAFGAAQGRGETVSQLAAQYSIDPSKTKGGAYGCYPPTSSQYSGVRNDVGTDALNVFPKTPQLISYNGGTYALYVAVTKRTPTPFATAQSAVLNDLQSANANAANTIKQRILALAAVAVDPAFGRWGLNTTGPMVFVPAIPSASDVGSSSTLTTASAPSYK
ncbi:MAG: hypothetical protein HKL86_07005 [Acidimicrobiaceae bacterium]|nr:hypothetical protein [Acidimicrobiaceae bacterium]